MLITDDRETSGGKNSRQKSIRTEMVSYRSSEGQNSVIARVPSGNNGSKANGKGFGLGLAPALPEKKMKTNNNNNKANLKKNNKNAQHDGPLPAENRVNLVLFSGFLGGIF